jgi:hypothetical protein
LAFLTTYFGTNQTRSEALIFLKYIYIYIFNVELQPTHNKSDGYKARVTMGTFRLPEKKKV